MDEKVAAGFIVPESPGELTPRALLGPLIAYAPVGLALVAPDFRFAFVNATFASFNRLSVAQHQGATVEEVLSAEVWSAMRPYFDRALAGEVVRGQHVAITASAGEGGGRRHFLVSYFPLWSDRRTVNGVGFVTTDITESKQSEALVAGQNRLLERIATDAPLEGTLTALVQLVEDQAPGMICAVQLVDAGKDGGGDARLRLAAGPNVPGRYAAQLREGTAVRADAVGGAVAAFQKATVVTPDLTTDPSWVQSGLLAARSGLRSCWSTPIIGDRDEVLGTVDVFHRQAHTPDERERRMVDAAVHTARIAIERDREQMRRGILLRDMLMSLTEGRLRLCLTAADVPQPLFPTPRASTTLTAESLREFRRSVTEAAKDVEMPVDRRFDLETAVGEASMNTVVHAGGGEGMVYADTATGAVQVWVRDRGKGIPLETLHRATLERGYTTAGTLGHGFWMILRTVDRCWLLTGDTGTTVVLEQGREGPEPDWLNLTSG